MCIWKALALLESFKKYLVFKFYFTKVLALLEVKKRIDFESESKFVFHVSFSYSEVNLILCIKNIKFVISIFDLEVNLKLIIRFHASKQIERQPSAFDATPKNRRNITLKRGRDEENIHIHVLACLKSDQLIL